MKKLFFIPLVLLFVACKTYSDEDLKGFDKKIEGYLKKRNMECERSASGLYYRIEAPGDERKIKLSDIVTFKYKGTLLNGKVFDDHMDEPVEFNVSTLIAGWKEVMLELGKGGKAFLVVPPQLGYGTHELDDIPKNSILAFELEVIDVQ